MGTRSDALVRRSSRIRRLLAWLGGWEPSSQRVALTSRAQILLLPRMTFWLRSDVRRFFLPVYGLGLVFAIATASALGLSSLGALLVGATIPYLTLGSFERLLRKAVTTRRRVAELPAAQ